MSNGPRPSVLVGLAFLASACGSGWKDLPTPPRAPVSRVTHAALAPDRPYALPAIPPAPAAPAPPPWPRGEGRTLDTTPVPVLLARVRDRNVQEARKWAVEETWSSLGGSGFRRVELTRDGPKYFVFEATGSRSDRRFHGSVEVMRRGRIAAERVDRLVVRIATLGRQPEDGPVAKAAERCVTRTCGSSRLAVSATTVGGAVVTYTNDLGPCGTWSREGLTMNLEAPGAQEAAADLLALTVDAARATNAPAEVSFVDDLAQADVLPTK